MLKRKNNTHKRTHNGRANRKSKQAGFTLGEVLISLAMTGVLSSIAVPGFQGIMVKDRLAAQSNDSVAALNLTRSEAIKRGTRVTLCKSADSLSCSSNAVGYEQGWIISTDNDNDAVVDGDEDRLHISQKPNHATLSPSDAIADCAWPASGVVAAAS